MISLKKILAEKGKGMWANIHAKRKRGEKPAKKGDKDYPDKKSWDDNKNELFVKKEDYNCFTEWLKENKETFLESEYQGRKVKLNKPMQGDVSKFKVYVKDGDKVIKVNFGAKGMVIKKDNPARRKSFRARFNCDTPGPKTKARYWSCKKW
tara:strand:+ start:436 stop:888 length:453 start_codon:yes stop_codon:yes gene_type:complete